MKTRQVPVPIKPWVPPFDPAPAENPTVETVTEFCHRFRCGRCGHRWSEWQRTKTPKVPACPECHCPPETFFQKMHRFRERLAELKERGFGGRTVCRNSNAPWLPGGQEE